MVNNILLNGISWSWSSVLSFHLLFYVVRCWKSYLVHVCLLSGPPIKRLVCRYLAIFSMLTSFLETDPMSPTHIGWCRHQSPQQRKLPFLLMLFHISIWKCCQKKKKAGHVIYLVGLFLLNNRPILVPYGLVPSVPSNSFAQIL